MRDYKEFIFTEYKFDFKKGELSLRYSLDNQIDFEEKVFFEVNQIDFTKVDQIALEKAFFNLHLIGGISYYKTYCPRELRVESGELSEEQIKFWEKIYKRGLGEFFYRNQIDFRRLVKFKVPLEKEDKVGLKPQLEEDFSTSSASSDTADSQESGRNDATNERVGIAPKCLVPIGGGKDSLVTAELLKKAGFDFTLFSLGDSLPQKETAKLVGKDRLIVHRKLSPNLFELNKQGVYNGHIPISAYIAFLGLATSILYGYDYIILSNENSANYGNLDYLGMNINHQYSKSLEFEKDFNNYVSRNITAEIHYFSLLRPFYELKIAEIFSQFPKYFQSFTSCNKNFKLQKKEEYKKHPERISLLDKGETEDFISQDCKNPPNPLYQGGIKKWCCDCPKCAFVYAILAPFLSKEKMLGIFGKNLFEEENLKNLFLELLGVRKNKPFECVGTAEEVAVAFYLTSQKTEFQNDFMIKIFKQEVLAKIEKIGELKKKVFGVYLEDSLVPEEFKISLK